MLHLKVKCLQLSNLLYVKINRILITRLCNLHLLIISKNIIFFSFTTDARLGYYTRAKNYFGFFVG